MRNDLLGLTAEEFSSWLRPLVGHSDRFHRAAYRHLCLTGRWDPATVVRWREADVASPGLIDRLAALAAPDQLPVSEAEVEADDGSRGTTRKLRLRLADGAAVESVAIPMAEDGRRTACLSSQVGCRMGCSFCATATMGLVRQLTAAEMVGQFVAVERLVGGGQSDLRAGPCVRNAVFMGMGEPLDNPEAVAQAVRVLTDGTGLGLAWESVTISTVGRVAGLKRWAELGMLRTSLAISLHTADPDLRAELVPWTRAEPLPELRRCLAELPLGRNRHLLVALVVIPGVTDTPRLIDLAAEWLRDLPALVNLIPYNPIPGRDWRPPTSDEVLAVRDQLDRRGIKVRVRLTKGAGAAAACGQLVTGRRREAGNRKPAAEADGQVATG